MNIDEIKQLIDLMRAHELQEIELEEEGRRVRLVKRSGQLPLSMEMTARPASQTAAKAPEGKAEAPLESELAPGTVTIQSPMVGTYYRSSGPDADPYVEEGDSVDNDTVVCIIEAMKVMNEIKAEVTGVVKEILVANGEPVEYGQPLFLIDTDLTREAGQG
jgi:acetyl-CoA carboxylase biotin carboxyl carrier protein